ncbi:MAG: 50S ribosomal protein L23 [Deltaproteobacteria bacterium]|nr:50S ribosomal protein L23 [Deltaproteobacteria bacterium]MBW2070320.1 50S ribosomal protein L23 [Deltaproteobacteria bacterium]
MENPHQVLRRPLITEKSTIQKELHNQLTFEVDRRANKVEIKRAVEEIFKVKVHRVCTSNYEGKKKRLGRFEGRRRHWKKAVVTLKPGQKIEFFEGV